MVRYSKDKLLREAYLFIEWYLPRKLRKKKLNHFQKRFKKIFLRLSKAIKLPDDVFVHRDFHVSNIMLKQKKFHLIDSQDAVIGNPAYDLASLIDDVRIKLPLNLQNKLFKFYHLSSHLRKNTFNKLKNDFEILSVQRNLKILGIFVRLHIRDGKSNYHKYLPYAWSLIERRLKNPVFKKFIPSDSILSGTKSFLRKILSSAEISRKIVRSGCSP